MSQIRTISKAVRGHTGPFITRLVSPDDLGHELKPFVFLDFLNATIPDGFGFPYHSHSGIATLTYQLNADVSYIDTEEHAGVLLARGLEWMQAGGGAWHRGTFPRGGPLTGFQLWIALPPDAEEGPSYSQYVAPDQVVSSGGVKVLLGEYQQAKSTIKSPSPINYYDVHMSAGDSLLCPIPVSHDVAWAFVYEGQVRVNDVMSLRELLIFKPYGEVINLAASTEARVLVASAVKHPHPLHVGYSSVHTSESALKRCEQRIAAIGAHLRAAGKLT